MATGVLPDHLDHNDEQDDTVDDDWFEDGSDVSELNRERKTRENEFHKMGYRDGVIAGKEASAQDGFNLGYKQAVLVGYNWGLVRGVTSALACLPARLKDRLAANIEGKDRLEKLHELVLSVSAADALKMFHDGMLLCGSENTHNQPEGKCSAEFSVDEAAGGFGQLGTYYRELESITNEFPDIKIRREEKSSVYSK